MFLEVFINKYLIKSIYLTTKPDKVPLIQYIKLFYDHFHNLKTLGVTLKSRRFDASIREAWFDS